MFRTMQTSSAACALCAVAAGGPALDGQPGPGGRRVLGQGPSPRAAVLGLWGACICSTATGGGLRLCQHLCLQLGWGHLAVVSACCAGREPQLLCCPLECDCRSLQCWVPLQPLVRTEKPPKR